MRPANSQKLASKSTYFYCIESWEDFHSQHPLAEIESSNFTLEKPVKVAREKIISIVGIYHI